MTRFIAFRSCPSWKAIAKAEHAKAHKALRRAVTAEQELASVPKAVRVLCRIVGRLVRKRGSC